MNRFDTCLLFTLQWERDADDPPPRIGEVGPDTTNHPDDPGGLTNDGVTQGVYDEFRRSMKMGHRSVSLMRVEERNAIYRRRWDAVHAGECGEPLDLALFDYATNSGTFQATKDLQRVLGAVPDGVFGPKTLAALAGTRGAASNLAHALCARRRLLVEKAILRAPSLVVFRRGWLRRIEAVEKALF